MDVSICIVSWNTRDRLDECLRSIADEKGSVRVETFVVDNASTDGSPEMVAEKYSWVHLIANRKNVGFAAANNQAIELTKGRHVLMLNPDTAIRRGALRTMVNFMDEHSEAGGIGCRLVGPDGKRQNSVRGFPSFRSVLHQFTAVRLVGLFANDYRAYRMRSFDDTKLLDVDSVMGAALMMRTDALQKIGLLDPGFFMYYEEVDICRRLRDVGYKIYFVPGATIMHYGGQSTEQARVALSRVRMQSLFRYLEKHKGVARTRAFKLFFKPLFYLKLVVDLPGDLFSWFVLKTFRRDAPRARRSADNIRAKLSFFGRNLPGFLFCD